MIDIDPNGDLIVTVVESNEGDSKVIDISGRLPSNSYTAEFKVQRKVLIESSQVCKVMLAGSGFLESRKNSVRLEKDRAISMELWFRVLHKVPPVSNDLVPLAGLWDLVVVADKYAFDIKKLYAWFAWWYEKRNAEVQNTLMLLPRGLLYPVWRFDHAKGFMAVTKRVVYCTTGHIVESNPTKHFELHLPSRIIQQMNAAKGRLRTILHNKIWEPAQRLLQSPCPCSKATFHDYFKVLTNREVYPLEDSMRTNSVNEILNRLDNFVYVPTVTGCQKCCIDYNALIENAQEYVQNYFDGLCLDCLDSGKPKTGDADLDYWRHHNLKQHEWTTGCRVRHKQPTWYYSFMGRKEDRDRFMKAHPRPLQRRRRSDSDSDNWYLP